MNPSILIDQIIDALAALLTPFVTPCPVIRAQVNRVPPPLTGYVELRELHRAPLETPNPAYTSTTLSLTTPTQIDIQMDFYGPSSGDQCAAITTIFRSGYAAAQFPDGIKPLFCSDGTQSPLVTGEEQYESRWTATASLQYNPIIALPQQTANELSVAVLEEIS